MPTLIAYSPSFASAFSVYHYTFGSFTFSEARVGTVGSKAFYAPGDQYLAVAISTDGTTNKYDQLYRTIISFDVSALPSSAIIKSATLHIRKAYDYDNIGLTEAHKGVAIVEAEPADPANGSLSDFSSVSSYTRVVDTDIPVTTTDDTWTRNSLNSNGIARLYNTGYFSVGLLLQVDADNNTPAWVSEQTAVTIFNSTQTSYQPYLEIEYYYPASVATQTSNPYADGEVMRKVGGVWTSVTDVDMCFTTYTTSGATTVTYNSQDPSDILRAVIDNYNDYGGTVTYDATSIDDTGTTVSYTFTTQTTYECISKCLELAPSGWYWYVDPATNLIHFHEKSSSADHNLTLEKDLKDMIVEKRTESIVNTVYFRGGDTTGSEDYLYKKYQDSESVGLYGIRAQRYVDERVTVEATADIIANSIIEGNKAPEIRLSGSISDSNPSGYGYDIESIQVGDVIRVGNVSGNTTSSLWDTMLWDTGKWDYNIQSIGSMYLQTTRTEYSPDALYVYCSTTPPDISKRIEDINRNLQLVQMSNNPDTPT